MLASGLPFDDHVVEMYRRTEGSFGPTIVQDVVLESVELAIEAVHVAHIDPDQDDEHINAPLLGKPESEFEAKKLKLV